MNCATRDKVLFSLNGNGNSFGTLVRVGSLHHSDQFAVYELQGGDLLPLDAVFADVRGSWRIRDRPRAFEGRFQNQAAGAARKLRCLLIRRQPLSQECREQQQTPNLEVFLYSNSIL